MTAYLARAVRMSVFLARLREELQTVSSNNKSLRPKQVQTSQPGQYSISQFRLLTEPGSQGPASNYIGLLPRKLGFDIISM